MSEAKDNITRVEDVTDKPTEVAPSVPSAQQQSIQSVPSTQQSVQSTPPTQQQQPTQQQPPDMMNLVDAIRAISAQYEREFPKLVFNAPMQITDGCVAEFVDASMGVTVASVRIRVRNHMIINNDNGDLFLKVHLSDLTFSRSTVPVALNRGK